MSIPATFTAQCSAPRPVFRRAAEALRAYACGARNFSSLHPHRYLVIRIGLRWRLLSKTGGKTWLLMTHEAYNKESKK